MINYHYSSNKKNIFGLLIVLFISIIVGVFSSIYSTSFYYFATSIIILSILMLFLTIKTDQTILFLVTLLVISLFLVPGFSLAGIGVRLDDAIVVFLTIFLMYLIIYKKTKYIQSPINKWINSYIVYMLLITLIQITLSGLSSIYILFSIKEVQYFIYFFGLLYVMKIEWFRNNFKNIFLYLSLITMTWGCYQLVSKSMLGYYGIGLISESASSQSGGVYFLISMFFLYLINSEFRFKQRIIYFVFFIGSAGLLMATISRTAMLAFVITYVVYLCFSFMRITVNKVAIWVYSILLVSPFVYLIIKDYLSSILDRLSRIDQGTSIRTEKWEWLLSHASDLGLIFGEGRGFVQTITGGMTLSADSQYIRNILELGYIGSVLFLLVILSIIVFALKNIKSYYGESLFIILITCGFMVMSITHEVFLVTIQASFYWMLIGAFVGKILHDKRTNTALVIH